MSAITWKSDGNENWSSWNGYVGDRLRFHVVGEKYGSKVVGGWDLAVFGSGPRSAGRRFSGLSRLKDAKRIASDIVEKESSATG